MATTFTRDNPPDRSKLVEALQASTATELSDVVNFLLAAWPFYVESGKTAREHLLTVESNVERSAVTVTVPVLVWDAFASTASILFDPD